VRAPVKSLVNSRVSSLEQLVLVSVGLVCVLLAVLMCVVGYALRRKAMSSNDGDDQDARMSLSSC